MTHVLQERRMEKPSISQRLKCAQYTSNGRKVCIINGAFLQVCASPLALARVNVRPRESEFILDQSGIFTPFIKADVWPLPPGFPHWTSGVFFFFEVVFSLLFDSKYTFLGVTLLIIMQICKEFNNMGCLMVSYYFEEERKKYIKH